MIDVQQAEVAPAPVHAPDVQSATPASNKPIDVLALSKRDCAAVSDRDEVVVCGRRSNEQFRLRPLPSLPRSEGFLSRPLRVQIAPGISFGFQKKGGLGLRAELGPGKKTDEIPDSHSD
jgi:hypothetical protein